MRCPSKRILLVGNFLSSSVGTRGVAEDLRDHLEGSGWKVITTSNRSRRIIRIIHMILTTLRYSNSYCTANIDVFSGPSFLWAEAISLILGLMKKPYVVTLHGGKLAIFAQRWPNRIRRLLAAAKVVTTPSIYLRSSFSGIREDIILLRNAVDLSSYVFRHRPSPRPKLAWLRAFHMIYNPMMAAQVLDILADDFPNIELTMFGPDKADGSLDLTKHAADERGVRKLLNIPGPIPKPEVPHHLAGYDVFLNTTTAESFGVAVVEAAALGMCIVTTNVGELPYIWTHEHDALLVPPNDPEAMAAAVRRILTEPGLAERLSRNARHTAEQFDWSVILPQWEQLLLSVIDKHK